jgi:Glycosyl transferase family 2
VKHKTSIVIASRDEPPDILQATLDGLKETTPSMWREIVIVDDSSVEPIQIDDPEVVVIRNEIAVGVCPSRRIGCAAATGDTLLITDPHMSFRPGWLDEMLQFVDSGSLLCSTWHNYDFDHVHSYGAKLGWNKSTPMLQFRGVSKKPKRKSPETDLVIGACYMISRQSYEHLGGFCPLLRTWGLDEEDLSVRAWMAGLGVRLVRDAQVGHLSRKKKDTEGWPFSSNELFFNSTVLMRSIFDKETLELFAPFFEPVSPLIQDWLDEVDLAGWRERVQSVRKITDREFFSRFGSRMPVTHQRPHISYRARPAGWPRGEHMKAGRRFEWSERTDYNQTMDKGSLTFVSFGAKIQVEWDDRVPRPLLDCLPQQKRTTEDQTAETVLGLRMNGTIIEVWSDEKRVVQTRDPEFASAMFENAYQVKLREQSSLVFLAAAAVEYQGKILVLPRTHTGCSFVLVADLLNQGAKLISPHFLVLDQQGEIWPYQRTNSELPASLEGPIDGSVSLVAATHYRPGSRWRPKKISKVSAIRDIIAKSPLPEELLGSATLGLARLTKNAEFVQSPRDCSQRTAAALIRRLIRMS